MMTVAALIEALNAERPDAVVLVGDVPVLRVTEVAGYVVLVTDSDEDDDEAAS